MPYSAQWNCDTPNAMMLTTARSTLFTVVSLCLCAPAPLFCQDAGAERTDRVIAVVGDRVVTAWDRAFEEAMTGHMGCPEAVLCDEKRPLDERLADLAVIRGLAGDAAAYKPTLEELERRLAALRASWVVPGGYHDCLELLGLNEDELTGLLYSRMVVERFVQRNVGLPVAAVGGGPQEYARRYESWIAEQRAQVSIRFIPPLEEP